MKKQFGAIILVLIVWALCMAENALAQTKCRLVNVHMTEYMEEWGVEACDIEGWCGEGSLIGTFNGRLIVSGLDSESADPFNDSVFWKGQSTIEMKDGEIYAMTTGVNFFRTWYTSGVSTAQESHAVTGGSGRYEGASGYILMNYVFGDWDNDNGVFATPSTGELTGQVCWPQE